MSKKPWRTRHEAARELEDAARWYESERAGLGEEFLAAVEEALRELRESPSQGSPLPKGRRGSKARRHLLARFPYAIVFAELAEAYEVVAVAHVRRHPGYWRARLKKPSP